MVPMPVLKPREDEDNSPGVTEIQLGGLNTTDSRFSGNEYKGYTGCLSSECYVKSSRYEKQKSVENR